MTGKAAASPVCWRCPNRRSRSNAPSSSPRSPSAKTSCGVAPSLLASSRARPWTRRFKRWPKDEAARRWTPPRQTTNRPQPRPPPQPQAASCFVSGPASWRFPASFPNTPPISTTGRPNEVQRDQSVRALRRADHGDHGGRLGGLSRRQASVRPLRPDTARLASRPFRACALCYHRLVACRYGCPLEPLMSGVELKANDAKALAGIKRRSVLSSIRVVPILVTAVAVAVAAAAGWQAWQYYMGAPWTRDGTVRAYVVKIAPQVAGEIVKLPIVDNQFVHKGDLLMLIDPRNYSIAVRQAEATVEQTRAVAENANAEMIRREKLNDIAVTMEERQTYISQAATAEANYQAALANLDQARINLNRTQVRSPVNGYITNLTAQLGDYANVGALQLSVVNSDSYWVDAYFEETDLGRIQDGDAATIKLMG